MLIRCEKCSTVYELEDRLIPPGGAAVQCSRCDHVFRAFRDKGADPLLQVVPPPEPEPEPGAEPHGAPDLAAGASPAGDPVVTEPPRVAEPPPWRPASERRGGTPPGPMVPPARPIPAPPPPDGVTPEGRPIRKVPNPELDGDMPMPTAPRKAISYEVGPRKPRTGRYAIAAAVALVVVLGVIGSVLSWRDTRTTSRPASPSPAAPAAVDPGAARLRQDGLALLARDDAASLERAASKLDEAVRREGAPGAHADRALALAVLSIDTRDDADRLDGRARAAEDARGAASAAGDEARVAELERDGEALRAGVAPARERAARLAAEAKAELDGIARERQNDPLVVRARAMAFVAAGQRDDAARVASAAGGAASGDPWVALAAILATLPENAGQEEHARALEALDRLSAARPELVHARFLAARIRAGMGDGEGALSALDALLRLNPDHLEARRLRAEVVAAATPPSAAPRSPSAVGGRPASRPPAHAPPAAAAPLAAPPAVPAPAAHPAAPGASAAPAPQEGDRAVPAAPPENADSQSRKPPARNVFRERP